MNSYHPTLWRTCRALANVKRLGCLKAVLAEPALTVGEVAGRVGIAENHVSECLRALQARGLIQARRHSRWVQYVPVSDPLVPCARPLLSALRRAMLKENRPADALVSALTAFTHPRRIVIMSCLQKHRSISAEALARLTGISVTALYRHLGKLSARGLLAADQETWCAVTVSDPLLMTLLGLLDVKEE